MIEADRVSTALERRKERQRRHVIEVAADLFHEYGGEQGGGLEAITVEMISARADISTRTFFRYFESKLDVIYLDHRRSVADLMRLVTRRLEAEPVGQAVMHASIEQLDNFTAAPLNRDRLLRALRSPAYADRLAIWRLTTRQRLVDLLNTRPESRGAGDLVNRQIVGIARNIHDSALELWAHDPRLALPSILLRFVDQTPAIASDLYREAVALSATRHGMNR